ncbi:CotH kinase family protein [Oscillospiraceae bacterium PP1C4]
MKYKIISVVTIMLMLVVALVASVEVSEVSQRIHHHLLPNEKSPCTHGEDVFCSHLPLIAIDTKDQNLFLSKLEVNGVRQTISNTILGEIALFDSQTHNNHISDKATISSLANIRYRGNSSILFDKKSYKINLLKDDLTENKAVEFLGMPAYDEWVLNGPILDRTLIRNYLCMNVSGQIMADAPEVRFCELFVDSEYRGVYVAMESIAKSVNRVNLTSYKDGDPFSSYLIKSDWLTNNYSTINNFAQYTIIMDTKTIVDIDYPPSSRLSPKVKEYIERDFSRFEKALYSFDYDDDQFGYKSNIDVNSFVDYFIINEFFKNYDAGYLSTYFYKDLKEKIHIGPVWDFNSAGDNYGQSLEDRTFGLVYAPRYNMLFKDEDFVNAVIARYRALRKTVLSEEYLVKYIDQTTGYLGEAVKRNYEVWGDSFDPTKMNHNIMLQPLERNPVSYDEAVAQLREFVIARGSWMDKNIEILKQYCHESKVKKYNH